MNSFLPFAAIIFIFLLHSCTEESSISISSTDSGYVIENDNEIIAFDKNLNFISLKPNSTNELSELIFEENKIKKILYVYDNSDYIIWLDSIMTPVYLEKSVAVNSKHFSKKEIFYEKNLNREILTITSTIRIDKNNQALMTDQYLEFDCNKIDYSKSFFYTIKKIGSKTYFTLNCNEKYDSDVFFILLYYTDPIPRLSLMVLDRNLYYKDDTKITDELFFKKEDSLHFQLTKGTPTTVQLYTFDSKTNKPVDYKVWAVNTSYCTTQQIFDTKDIFQTIFKDFTSLNLNDIIQNSLEKFDFISNDKKNDIKIDKKKLKDLIQGL